MCGLVFLCKENSNSIPFKVVPVFCFVTYDTCTKCKVIHQTESMLHIPRLNKNRLFCYLSKIIITMYNFFITVDYIACLSNPCQHNGTCKPRGTVFYCACTEDHSGTICEGKCVYKILL